MKVYTSCTDVREDFSALLDDALENEEREAIESHLGECSECLRELDGLKQVDTLYRALPTVNAPANFDDRLKRAIRPGLLRFPSARKASRRFGPALAAAAALIIVGGVSFFALPGRDESPVGNLAMQSTPPDPAPKESSPAVGDFDGLESNRSDDADTNAGLTTDARKLESIADAGASIRARLDEVAASTPMMRQRIARTSEPREAELRDAGAEPARPQAIVMQESLGAASTSVGEADQHATQRTRNRIFEESLEGLWETPKTQKTITASLPAPSSPPPPLPSTTSTGNEFAEAVAPNLEIVSASKDEQFFLDSETVSAGARPGRRAAQREEEPATIIPEKKLAKAVLVRALDRREGVWYQKEYVDAPVHAIARDGEPFRAMLDADPDLARFARLDDAVVFRFGERWFRLPPVQR